MMHWSEKKKEDIGQALQETVAELQSDHSMRLEKYKRMTELYKDKEIDGFEPGQWRPSDNLVRPATNNVLRSSIDTIVAKITLHTPSPKASTFGGDEEMQDRARAMEKLVLGVIQQEKVNRTGRLCFRDSGIYDISVVKIFEEDGKIRVRRVHPARILVDESTSIDGRPQSIYEIGYHSKKYLLNKYPKQADEIAKAKGDTRLKDGRLTGDQIEVVEAWSLPCGKKQGKRVVIVNGGGVLVNEEWEDETFPFVFGYWDDDVLGFYGIGLAEQLEGIQGEINEIFDAIRENRIGSRPYWIKDKTSKIIDGQAFNNITDRIVEYIGTPPQRITPPIISEQELRLLQMLIQWGFEVAGVSQLSATSRQPANFESGAALRQYLDVETVRHSVAAKQFEQWYIDLFRQIVNCARRIASRNPSWAVNYLGKDGLMERVQWSQVSMDKDQFHLYVQPISALPQHPSARLERVMEMKREQLIDNDEFRALADMPDLEKYNRLKTAPYEQFERIFEHMLRTGKYIPPLPYGQKLALGIQIAAGYYSKAWIEEQKQDRIDLIVQWMMEAGDILTQQPPAPMEGPMGPQQPSPQGQPMGSMSEAMQPPIQQSMVSQ